MAREETTESIRLLQVATQNRVDYFLATLLEVFASEQIGVGIPLGFLIGGTIVRGRLARPEEFANALDETFLGFARSANYQVSKGVSNAKEIEELRESLTRVFAEKPFADSMARRRRVARRVREAIDKVWGAPEERDPEKLWDFSDLPDDLAGDAVTAEAPPVAFTLDQAEIHGPGGFTRVSRIRVVLRQVDAWWIDVPDAGSIEPTARPPRSS